MEILIYDYVYFEENISWRITTNTNCNKDHYSSSLITATVKRKLKPECRNQNPQIEKSDLLKYLVSLKNSFVIFIFSIMRFF